ncbi:MAG: hypothetical protein LBI79_03825 [Nitrososphaerota archaeon]|jgi:hypothetical protein|nr:hypothetical protein [Nitrososphaerota archaeon]
MLHIINEAIDLGRAKSKKLKDFLRGREFKTRLAESIRSPEEKLAIEYCHTHSIHAKCNGSGGVREMVFIGSPEALEGKVLAAIGGLRRDKIPECPQGLVIHSSDGTGAFD